MTVSKEGEKFLIDTKVYLITKGIKEEDVDAFIEDAELHLIEGEKEGKTVRIYLVIHQKSMRKSWQKRWRRIKGEYKEHFRNDNWDRWILVTNILFESPNHEFVLTNVQLIGYPIVLMITVAGIIFAFKMSSFKSKIKEFSIIYVALLPILLLVLLMFMNKWYGTPVLQLTTMQSYILAGTILIVLLVAEAYILGWIGILAVIVPLLIMFVFKELEQQNPYWGMLEPLLLYGSLYVLMRWSLKNEEKKL